MPAYLSKYSPLQSNENLNAVGLGNGPQDNGGRRKKGRFERFRYFLSTLTQNRDTYIVHQRQNLADRDAVVVASYSVYDDGLSSPQHYFADPNAIPIAAMISSAGNSTSVKEPSRMRKWCNRVKRIFFGGRSSSKQNDQQQQLIQGSDETNENYNNLGLDEGPSTPEPFGSWSCAQPVSKNRAKEVQTRKEKYSTIKPSRSSARLPKSPAPYAPLPPAPISRPNYDETSLGIPEDAEGFYWHYPGSMELLFENRAFEQIDSISKCEAYLIYQDDENESYNMLDLIDACSPVAEPTFFTLRRYRV